METTTQFNSTRFNHLRQKRNSAGRFSTTKTKLVADTAIERCVYTSYDLTESLADKVINELETAVGEEALTDRVGFRSQPASIGGGAFAIYAVGVTEVEVNLLFHVAHKFHYRRPSLTK